jgi:hypothetical protein
LRIASWPTSQTSRPSWLPLARSALSASSWTNHDRSQATSGPGPPRAALPSTTRVMPAADPRRTSRDPHHELLLSIGDRDSGPGFGVDSRRPGVTVAPVASEAKAGTVQISPSQPTSSLPLRKVAPRAPHLSLAIGAARFGLGTRAQSPPLSGCVGLFDPPGHRIRARFGLDPLRDVFLGLFAGFQCFLEVLLRELYAGESQGRLADESR